MIVYLDNCMFNRPFDNQESIRVRLETEAKLYIQELIKINQLSLVWSHILTYENAQNPFVERKFAIAKWQALASYHIEHNQNIVRYAKQLVEHGLKSKDALHVACAVEAKAVYFLSTDDKLLKKLKDNADICALNPTAFIQVLTNDY